MDGAGGVAGTLKGVPGGVELAVFCQPKAARSGIVGLHAGQLKVKVTAVPVAGRANEALLVLLSEALGVPRRNLSLLAGEQSRMKRVRVVGIETAAATQALLAQLPGAQMGLFPAGEARAVPGREK